MTIKEFYGYDIENFTEEIVVELRSKKKSVSKEDKKFLSNIYKKKLTEIDSIIKAIKLHSIWEPDDAINLIRKKGLLRYKSHEMKINKVLILINDISKDIHLFNYSDNILEYLDTKKQLSWLFNFYRYSEKKLTDEIKKHHANRIRKRINNVILESALFKELLAYIDITFTFNNTTNYDPSNKNVLNGYSKEEQCDAISYITFLYNKEIGIKSDANYMVDVHYVVSDDIQKIILSACKILEMQEWEISIDFLDYKVQINNNNWTICDAESETEKCIRLGYIRTSLQEQAFYITAKPYTEDFLPLSTVVEELYDRFKETLIEEKKEGILSRYTLKFTSIIFQVFRECFSQEALFKEEALIFDQCSKELAMTFDEAVNRKITANCTLKDIIVFQRFFRIANIFLNKVLFKKNNRTKSIMSLIPLMSYDNLFYAINHFINNEIKTNELLDLFIIKNDIKIDLQYTPLVKASGGVLYSNTLVVQSNLIRNSIAYSYQIKNQIPNDDNGLEPLVKRCCEIFNLRKDIYTVFHSKNYKYKGEQGEIDVIIISQEDIILIECKCPILPINNFEIRSSLEHIDKANRQLDLSLNAFNDKSFRNSTLKSWGITYNNQCLRTCIIFGNRIFSGYTKSRHPIRYIYELHTVIRDGTINSTYGKWSMWKEDAFSHQDLLNFISTNNSLTTYQLNSLSKRQEKINVDGKQILFDTYYLNIKSLYKEFDKYYRIIESSDLKQEILDV